MCAGKDHLAQPAGHTLPDRAEPRAFLCCKSTLLITASSSYADTEDVQKQLQAGQSGQSVPFPLAQARRLGGRRNSLAESLTSKKNYITTN